MRPLRVLALALLVLAAGAAVAVAAAGGGSGGFGGGGGGGGGGGLGGGGGSGAGGSIGWPGALIIFGGAAAVIAFSVVQQKRKATWSRAYARARDALTASRRAKRREEVERRSLVAAEDDAAFSAESVREEAAALFASIQDAWDRDDRDALAAMVGPLIDLRPPALPHWLWLWEGDFDAISGMVKPHELALVPNGLVNVTDHDSRVVRTQGQPPLQPGARVEVLMPEKYRDRHAGLTGDHAILH